MGYLPDIAIIGPGKVGTSIAMLARKNGYRISAIAGRNENHTREAIALISGDSVLCQCLEAPVSAELALLTVSDNAIESVCASLSKANAFSPGQIVAHCSGALSSEVLTSARDLCGAKIGSAHPLQMFPTVEAALAAMPGSHWFCEGESDALEILENLVRNIGGIPHTISAENKALYHCSSVIACNYLNALMDVALTIAEQAGVDRATAWPALSPLVRATITNIDKMGTAASLTGPIERGDVDTVKRHLQALAETDPDIMEIYKVLGKWTIRLAFNKGSLDKNEQSQLRNALKNNDN